MGLNIGVFGVRDVPSTYSGYETFLTALLPELVQRGHQITVYRRGERGSNEPFEGIERKWLPSFGTKRFDTLTHGAVASVRTAVSDHDVVLVCNVANAPFLVALKARGIPSVLNVDGLEWLRGKWGHVAQRVFYNSAKVAKSTATTLITDCLAMQKYYLDEFQADSVPIPYCWTGIVDGEGSETRQKEVLNDLGLDSGEYYMIAARLNPENNVDRVVASYRERRDDPRPFLVLGKANYNSTVQSALNAAAAADGRVRLMGHVGDRFTFGTLLRNARTYFHGHSVGGINPSLVEAMGSGAMIAALETPFNAEALGDGGLYFQDPDRAMEEVLTQLPEVATEQLRDRAVELCETNFNLADITDKYEQVLTDAAARKR